MPNIANLPYLLALNSINGIGPIRLKAILDYFKDPKLAWESNSSDFLKIGIPRSVVDLLLEKRKTLQPESYAESIKNSGINWVTIFDANYPKLLKEIYDPPIVLYYRGTIDFSNQSTIAVVGTRKMTGYGRSVTDTFIKGLVSQGMVVVSGLARGIDTQAHTSTINYDGKTLAILGGGLNHLYPPENRSLAERIINGHGAVISEFVPDAPSLPGNFPSRNRIISGLSLAVLVIEAAEDSGSLITARLALEQGREVFAIPGPITSDLSKGPVSLIRDGARLVMDPQEILQELNIHSPSLTTFKNNYQPSPDEQAVTEALGNEQLHVDEVCRKLNWTVAKVSATLLKMEISGLVKNLGSAIYCKA